MHAYLTTEEFLKNGEKWSRTLINMRLRGRKEPWDSLLLQICVSNREKEPADCVIKAHAVARGRLGPCGDKGRARSLAAAVHAPLFPGEGDSAPIHMLMSPYKY